MHRYDADTVGRVRTDYLHRAQKYVREQLCRVLSIPLTMHHQLQKNLRQPKQTKYTKQLAEMKIYDEAHCPYCQ